MILSDLLCYLASSLQRSTDKVYDFHLSFLWLFGGRSQLIVVSNRQDAKPVRWTLQRQYYVQFCRMHGLQQFFLFYNHSQNFHFFTPLFCRSSCVSETFTLVISAALHLCFVFNFILVKKMSITVIIFESQYS